MNSVYHWIGLIVFWVIIAAVSIWCILFFGNLVLKAFKEAWKQTWLHDWWDYTKTKRKVFDKPEKCAALGGGNLWRYIRAVKYGNGKPNRHAFKAKFLAEVDKVLETYPNIRKAFDLEKECDYTRRAQFLTIRGWTEDKEARTKDISAWFAPEGYDIIVLNIYDAYNYEQNKVHDEHNEED